MPEQLHTIPAREYFAFAQDLPVCDREAEFIHDIVRYLKIVDPATGAMIEHRMAIRLRTVGATRVKEAAVA